MLFNGKDLDSWSYHVQEGEPAANMNDVWVVRNGLLVCTGTSTGYLMHKGQFENYILTLDWRWMRIEGSGVSVSGLGSIYIHTTDEKGAFLAPKSVEVSLNHIGAVFFRDVQPTADPDDWAFRAPDFADDVEKDMGEWNSIKLICRGKRLTVIANGVAVNQIDGLNRTKGAIALKSQRGTFPAPTYYRNIRVRPLTEKDADEEKKAGNQLAQLKAQIAQKKVAKQKRSNWRPRTGSVGHNALGGGKHRLQRGRCMAGAELGRVTALGLMVQ